MDDTTQQPAVPTTPVPQPADPTVGPAGLLLALVGLALGVALAWGWQQRRTADHATADAATLRTLVALAAAHQQDLTDLLTASGSQVVHLQPRDPARDLRAVIIWNPAAGAVALLCDGLWPLNHDQRYHLWAAAPDQPAPHLLGSFQADHGTTLYRFQADHAPAPRQFTLTAQPPDAAPAPAAVLFAGPTS